MKQETFNYEFKIFDYYSNILLTSQFHADNYELAFDHLRHILIVENGFIAEYKAIKNAKWRTIVNPHYIKK